MRRIIKFYSEGFRSMTIGRTLWLIILIKLFVIFVILRLLFFRDYLGSRFSNDEKKADYVIEQLTK